jgi:hypothetical protein
MVQSILPWRTSFRAAMKFGLLGLRRWRLCYELPDDVVAADPDRCGDAIRHVVADVAGKIERRRPRRWSGSAWGPFPRPCWPGAIAPSCGASRRRTLRLDDLAMPSSAKGPALSRGGRPETRRFHRRFVRSEPDRRDRSGEPLRRRPVRPLRAARAPQRIGESRLAADSSGQPPVRAARTLLSHRTQPVAPTTIAEAQCLSV